MSEHQPRASQQDIDPDEVASSPGLLPYAHHVGSAIVKPIDKGRVKGLAMSAMYEQTGHQLDQLKRQIEQLVEQAQSIHERIDISERIYRAEVGFKPNIGQTCYLYERPCGTQVLSLIGPQEWGKATNLIYRSTVRLLADHTWQVEHLSNSVAS